MLAGLVARIVERRIRRMSIALMQGRSTARGEVWALDGMELAIRVQAAKRVIDQRTVLRDKVRSMSSVDLATSYL